MYQIVFLSIVMFIVSNLGVSAEPRTVKVIQPLSQHTCPYHQYNDYYNNPNYYTRTHNNPPIYNRHRYQPQPHFSDINALEKYTMNRNFHNESNLERLQRLEMQAFGAVQSGDIDSRYENVRNAILARPNSSNTRNSILKNIGNYFTGQMTGFTPALNSSFSPSFATTPYPSSFGNQSIDEFSGPFRSGYRVNNYGVSSSTGVHILD